MFQKALAASVVVFLLACAPMALSAQDKEARAAEQASVLDWLSGVWSELAAWFAGGTSSESAGSAGDSGCLIDPMGCPRGAAVRPAWPAESAGTSRDSGCLIDPDGCPHGG